MTEHKFRIEVEKMISKQRIDDYGRGEKKKKTLTPRPTVNTANVKASEVQQTGCGSQVPFQTNEQGEGNEVKLNRRNKVINRNLTCLSALLRIV